MNNCKWITDPKYRLRHDMSLCVILFDNFADLCNVATRALLKGTAASEVAKVVCEGTGSLSWYGFTAAWTRPEIDKALSLGNQWVPSLAYSHWRKGLDLLSDMEAELAKAGIRPPSSRQRRTSWSEHDGDELCLDRLRGGNQSYWRTTRRKFSSGPSNVTLVLDIGMNWDHGWKDTLWRAAAAVITTELLERAGYRVQILATSVADNVYRGCPADVAMTCLLKDPAAPLDRSILINATSGWAFRSLWLNLCGLPAWHKLVSPKKLCRGLGRHGKPKLEHVSDYIVDDHWFLFDGAWNRKASIKLATETIKTIDPEMFWQADVEAGAAH